MAKIDPKLISNNIKKKSARKKTSLILNKELYEEFLKICHARGTSGSKVIEEFMIEYIK